MVVVDDPSKYTLKGFRASKTATKKIDAILVHKQTKREKIVPFGLKGSETYKNTTGVNVDTIHNDLQRRKRYRDRHAGEEKR
eukprot:37162-Eustigmatos_ZCMA.PRE.1